MKLLKIIGFLIKKAFQIGLILVAAWAVVCIAVLFVLYFCTGDYNISKKEPFKKAIGEHFVLQKDFQIYQFNSEKSKYFLGEVNKMGDFSYGLPKVIDKNSIGVEGTSLTIVGIAKVGTVLTIKKIIKNKSTAGTSYSYNALLSNNPFTKEVDTSELVDKHNNPPYTKTWSDPPIFDPKAALPLPSDGLWWK